MADDAALQMALAHDPGFLNRVQYTMVKYALSVKAEVPGTNPRRAFASVVLGDPAKAAASFAVAMVNSSNLMQGLTTIHPSGEVTTGESDASLFAVVGSLWDVFSGT